MEHRRVTDFIPRRAWPVAVGSLVGLTLIGVCLVLHHWLPHWLPSLSQPRMAAFDLEAQGSLAIWLSTIMLTKAAAACVLIYSIRQRRPDDYQGRYRIWIWMAGLVGLMSVSTTANLHLALQHVVVKLSGWTTNVNPAAIWLASFGLILLGVSLRLIIDVRRSRSTAALLVVTLLVWGVAAASEMGWLPLNAEIGVLVRQGSKMIGQLTLLTGVTLYLRYLMLDAAGALPVRMAKPKAEKQSTVKINKAGNPLKIDPAHKDSASEKRSDLHPHGPLKPTGKPAARNASDSDEYDDEDDEDVSDRKLSKADRKRMRRLKAELQRRDGLR